MSQLKLTTFVLLLLLVESCSGKEEEKPSIPANLIVNVDVATDGSGKVTLQATAENTEYYNIFFGESTNASPVVSMDGAATYAYTSSGIYSIKVEAHKTTSVFIIETKVVTVIVAEKPLQIPTEGYTTPTSYADMNLVWQDEFDGTSLNEAYWSYELGAGGWGNNELEYYRKENTTVRDGHLIITAKKENYQGAGYTSSRLITNNKKTFKYGRVDIRAVLPKGQGLWPALWMLGKNIGSVGWPKCGEIDIMEMVGGQNRENTVLGTLHWDNNGHVCTCDKPNSSSKLTSGIFSDKFHVFSLVWTESTIKWYMDDVLFNTVDITPEHMSEFREEFFFIFNVAVGGNWPGNPDNTTIFPQYMAVDYIRVFQNK